MHCDDEGVREEMVRTLQDGHAQLQPLPLADGGDAEKPDPAAPSVRAFVVGEYKASRKLIMPMLRQMRAAL